MLDIKLEGIHYENNNNIIEYLNMTIAEFGMYKIEGNNGIGKSTFFKALNGDINCVSSSVQFIDWDINIARTRDIVFGDDQFAGYLYLKPMEYLNYMVYLYKSEYSRKQLEAILDFMDMSQYLTTLIKNLSQGNKQKLAFIAVVISDAKIILLDEAFEHIDKVTFIKVRSILEELISDRIIFLTSHTDILKSMKYKSIQLSDCIYETGV